MKWNKSSNIYFPTDKKKVLFVIFFFVFSFTCNKLFYWHRQWIHLVGAGLSCTPARICSSCWCVRICLQYDSEVTSHLIVELVACSMTNQDLICFLKKMFCCCMYMSGGNVLKNLGDVDKVESKGGEDVVYFEFFKNTANVSHRTSSVFPLLAWVAGLRAVQPAAQALRVQTTLFTFLFKRSLAVCSLDCQANGNTVADGGLNL